MPQCMRFATLVRSVPEGYLNISLTSAVYDISVLSNIPLSVCDVIEPSAPVQRLRPLFCIGVHDISYLLEHQAALKRGIQGNDHDDPTNPADDSTSGWVACTTDSILAMKENLWDMLITMPPPYSSNATQRAWPTVECPKGVPVKATQRDLRRFRSLTHGLSRLATPSHPHFSQNPLSPLSERSTTTNTSTDSPPQNPTSIRLSVSRPATSGGADHRPTHPLPCSDLPLADDATDPIVEPTTWSALAYNGFMWWASAGEKRHSDELDEQSCDAALLADLAPPGVGSPVMGQGPRRESFGGSGNAIGSLAGVVAGSGGGAAAGGGDGTGEEEREEEEETQARVELAVVAYFHRLTTGVLGVLADIVDSSDEDDLVGLDLDRDAPELDGRRVGSSGDGVEEEDRARLLGGASGGVEAGRGWVRVDSEALAEMGLDVWSQADADFVGELAGRYFGRRAYVETKGVEVCGVRVC